MDIIHILANFSLFFVFMFVLVHLISKIFCRNPKVKLNEDSFVVITGGCMGIGKQMILEIAKKYRCKFLVIDIQKKLFKQLKQQVNQLGGQCQCLQIDLSNDESVQKCIENILKRKKNINLFIYNAGIIIPKKSWQTSDKQHMKVMKVNYFSPITMIHSLQPLLQGGHIGVTASMVAIIHGGIDVSTYSSSKHAIFAYLSSLRHEYKKFRKNITLSIGCPYAINTTMFIGFKTKLDFLFRILDQKYVGKRLAEQFIERKQVCFMYQYEALLFNLVNILPSNVVDYMSINYNVSDFNEIKDKHN